MKFKKVKIKKNAKNDPLFEIYSIEILIFDFSIASKLLYIGVQNVVYIKQIGDPNKFDLLTAIFNF